MKLLNRVRQGMNLSSIPAQAAAWPAVVVSLLALATDLQPAAAEDKPAQRPAVAPADPRRGQPNAGGERRVEAGRGGSREFSFPIEITLSPEQQAKLNELQSTTGTKLTELTAKREAIFTDAQKAARREVEQQARGGNLSRAAFAEKMSAALALTPEQQTQVTAVEGEFRQLRQDLEQQKSALLTAEQRETLRKLAVAQNASRVFAFPADILLSEQQTISLKALETDLGAKLTDLMERQGALLTEERRVARDAAAKTASEAGLGRAETGEAIRAALNFSEAEVAQLAEIETGLRELRTQIQDRKLGILTPEQRQQFELRFGNGRGR